MGSKPIVGALNFWMNAADISIQVCFYLNRALFNTQLS